MKLTYSLPFVAGVLILGLTGCTPSGIPDNANSMWLCKAADARQAHWFQYSPTRAEAATLVRNRCRAGSYRPTCVVRCFPPKSRWHCLSVDRKGHTWYRNAINKGVAIRNARRTCVKHSNVGGCRVPVGNCSVT